MKVGDIVCLVRLPERLKDAPGFNTIDLFTRCLGRSFPVVGVDQGFVELEVGHVLGEAPVMHSIFVEPDCLEVRPQSL